MKDPVILKSFSNGIRMRLDPEMNFPMLLEIIAQKFDEGRNFFGSANVALSIEGRELTGAEELRILEAIHAHSRLHIVCLVGHDEETDKIFIKALQQVQKRLVGDDEGQLYRGTLKDNDVIETDKSLIVLGDVNPGCAVISSRSVIVLGGLYGEAYAGGNGEDAYIAALELSPERLKIGEFKYKPSEKPRWGFKTKIQPRIAFVKNDRIVFEPFTKELLESF